jgi:SAM-dependent methyltransferase
MGEQGDQGDDSGGGNMLWCRRTAWGGTLLRPAASVTFCFAARAICRLPKSTNGVILALKPPGIRRMCAKSVMSVDAKLYDQRTSIAGRVSLLARTRIYEKFMDKMRPHAATTILDIGASDYEVPEANLLQKLYPFPGNITCATVGDPSHIAKLHPNVTVVPIEAGKALPFPDNYFDVSYSNAVLEHVGDRARRQLFLRESVRVAKSLFIVIPNRWFPVEHHTAVPLLHYAPPLFRALLSKSKAKHWADPAMLDFLGKRQLLDEWPTDLPCPEILYDGLRCGLLSSNIVIICRK